MTKFDIADAFRMVAEGLNQHALKPNILGYEPHEKQEKFHKSDKRTRLYLGGNRSGKTYGSVAEDIWWASKTHPYLPMPEGPVRGRVVAVDLIQGVNEIMLPIFSQLMPPSMLINGSWEDSYSKSERVLSFADGGRKTGSFIEFMSYEMETEKFAGTSRHFVHYDEEPPKDIYYECQARLVDTKGSSWISMTPLKGLTWVYDDLFEPWLDGKRPNVEIVLVEMTDNPHLDPESIEEFLSTLSEDDRLAREKGQFVQQGGLVFKQFKKSVHVLDEVWTPPKGWQIYSSVDHGWRNPTAWLWHAVSPNDEVVTFHEHYASEMTIEEHAQVVHSIESDLGLDPGEIIRTGDPALKQTSAITATSVLQEYMKHDIFIGVESVPRDPNIGIGRMQQYFNYKRHPDTGEQITEPGWKIAPNCVEFIKELERLRWKTYSSKRMQYDNNPQEKVHEKNDHAFDSAKYFATFLPELAPEPIRAVEGFKRQVGMRYDEALILEAQRREEKTLDTVWETIESF